MIKVGQILYTKGQYDLTGWPGVLYFTEFLPYGVGLRSSMLIRQYEVIQDHSRTRTRSPL